MKFSSFDFRRWFLFVFAFALLAINLVAYVFYRKNEEITSSRKWVKHTYEVIIAAEDLFSDVQDMTAAQRGYLLSPTTASLNSFNAAVSEVDNELTNINKLTIDNSARQLQLKNYAMLITQQENFLRAQLSQKRSHIPISELQIEADKNLTNQIRAANSDVLAGEQQLLNIRVAYETNRQESYVKGIFLVAGLSILGLLIANGVITFLTLRRQAAEEGLRRINKEMEGFTYIASHDLRSPLVNLKGFASEMKLGLEEVTPLIDRATEAIEESDRKRIFGVIHEDIPEALHYIHASVEKMDKLTNAILELSRIGRRPLKMEEIDPNKIVRHILDTLHHQIQTKRVTVTLHHMLRVTADQLSVEQVFGNIIDNAIKYLDPSRDGKLEIGSMRNYRETTFWVRDNGRGIPDHDMQKIFEIYRRGGNNENVPGEGMGMAYVRATLRRLDGVIWAESKMGEGSTFYFTVSNTLVKKESKDG